MTIITTNQYHMINLKQNDIDQLLISSIYKLLIDHNQTSSSLIFSSISNNKIINRTKISTNYCYQNERIIKRNTKQQYQSSRYHLFFFFI